MHCELRFVELVRFACRKKEQNYFAKIVQFSDFKGETLLKVKTRDIGITKVLRKVEIKVFLSFKNAPYYLKTYV